MTRTTLWSRPQATAIVVPWSVVGLACACALGAGLRLWAFSRVPPNPFYDAAVRSMRLSWHTSSTAPSSQAVLSRLTSPPSISGFKSLRRSCSVSPPSACASRRRSSGRSPSRSSTASCVAASAATPRSACGVRSAPASAPAALGLRAVQRPRALAAALSRGVHAGGGGGARDRARPRGRGPRASSRMGTAVDVSVRRAAGGRAADLAVHDVGETHSSRHRGLPEAGSHSRGAG
jgi:hypothetical protein